MSNPMIKFEHSPADSLADSFDGATPGASYSSLFDSTDPVDALTPPFDDNSSMFDQDMSLEGSLAGTPGPEKKPVKKRKSWGQQLPEPKTNLPPRKRAKTEDEKEQRRVERVLRNRRAAQSSRERKRMEVEALEAQKQEIERKNRDLELRLAHAEAQNLALQQQLAQITGGSPPSFKPTPSAVSNSEESYRQPSPLTLSQELFPSEGQAVVQTVDPASLTPETMTTSPELRPIDELSIARSSDMTQHPAAMLCDLPCQSEQRKPWMPTSLDRSTSLMMAYLSLISIAASSTFLTALVTVMASLTTLSSLPATSSILSTIIWLTTTSTSISTSTTSSTPTPRTPRSKTFSLRMNLLRRLLACSPQLARPLMDATMGAMRQLASEQQTTTRDCLDGGVSAGVGAMRTVGDSPSMECLMTLLWATRVIDQQQHRSSRTSSALERNSATQGIGRARSSSSSIEELFRARSITGASAAKAGLYFRGSGKSTDDWSMASDHSDGH